MEQPGWNSFDAAYGVIGLLILFVVWAQTDVATLIVTGGLTVVAYAAGRAAGSHR